ncbi:RNA polymerase sigma factor [Amycolatopsis sp. CA-128772]|uniref:RNA polymerase sigma factor n=1 Tax=Amycolatopsis sp. CA-128772 TaxID=2073159 RepID=UPI0011B014BA|nr:hypothetical protein [Amycolatopsis sp. CA-128772]
MQHDHELRDALLKQGFDSILWSRLVGELAEYGVAVITAWIRSGEIYSLSGKLCWHVHPLVPPPDDDERGSLAHDTVIDGIALFQRDGLLKGKWDPRSGASLTTYFVNACLLSFPNQCRKTATARKYTPYPVDNTHFEEPAVPATDGAVLSWMDAWTAFGDLPNDEIKKAVLYRALGYNYVEIAELLTAAGDPITPGAVRARINRQQRRSGVAWYGGTTS